MNDNNKNRQKGLSIQEQDEKIRKGWHECGNLVWKCQKHGFFYCRVLVSPTESHCQSCQDQKKAKLEVEAWIKAQEKAQNWWKSLSLSEKQEQIKLLEENIKNDIKYGVADIITWGKIKDDKTETYRNGKFSTTDIDKVPIKLVERFLDNNGINEPIQSSNSQPLNHNQSSQIIPNNPPTTNYIGLPVGNASSRANRRGGGEANRNQSHVQRETEGFENNDSSQTLDSQNQTFSSDSIPKKNIDISPLNLESKSKKSSNLLTPILILCLLLFSTLSFILWKKNKKAKS